MSRNYLILGASSDVGIQLIKEINDREKNAVIWAHYCSSDEHLKEIKQINGNPEAAASAYSLLIFQILVI